jgi:hypothetical protein
MIRQHMNRCSLIFIVSIIAMAAIPQIADSATPYYSTRTQTLSWPRIAGMTEQTNQIDKEDWYGTVNATVGYTRSFKKNDITRCLFGKDSLFDDCNCPFIRVSGSRIENRDKHDWLADYFGLPTDFKSEIFFNPRISNFMIDFNTHIGFDCWIPGAYLEIHAPFVHSKWELGFRENIIRFGDNDYDRGYFSTIPNREDDLISNVTCFMSHHGTPNLNAISTTPADNLQDLSLTITFKPLCFSRWTKRATATRFSDIYFMPGFNAIQGDNYSLGVYALIGAPAGTRPKGNILFEPIIGNGHHPEFGGGVTAYHHLFVNEECDTAVNFYLDAHISHLFNARQIRNFDLKPNGCNSRYMLAMNMQSPATNLFANPNPSASTNADSQAPNAQFNNIFTPVANLTVACVNVDVKIQGQATAMLNLHRCNLDIDLGYRFWGRSCERITLDSKCPHPLEKSPNTWALKGDAHVYGFLRGPLSTLAVNTPIALSGTQSKATIHTGTNNFIGSDGNQGGIGGIRPTRNPGVDNAQFARAIASPASLNADILDRQSPAGEQTKTSYQPIFFDIDDIDFDGARTKGISHTLFFDLTYSLIECGNWFPYLGIGSKIEFVPSNCSTACGGNTCSSCSRCCPSEWGVWFKGGVSFN